MNENEEKELEEELLRFQTSYIELLHRTSTEIEKLKLIIHILSCIFKKKPVPKHILIQLQKNETRLQDFGYDSALPNKSLSNMSFANLSMMNMNRNLELSLYQEMEQKSEKEELMNQIHVLRDSKLTLIKSSSFEIDRLRKMIRYLESKISGKPYVPSIRIPTTPFLENKANKKRSSAPLKTAYEWKEIKKHCSESDLWVVHTAKIYDISPFLRFHPGGGQVILEITASNQDITQVLKQLKHPPIAQEIMMKHFIGNVAADANQVHLSSHQPQITFPDLKPIWTPHNDDELAMFPDEDLLIKWIDDLSVKIDILDKQHLHIIHIINRLYLRYELKDILELLHRWDVHCKTEETLFFYYNFDEEEQQKHILDHKRIYHKIKDEITDLRIKYNNEKPQCHELIAFAQRFVKLFVNHHGEYDSKYIDHLDK